MTKLAPGRTNGRHFARYSGVLSFLKCSFSAKTFYLIPKALAAHCFKLLICLGKLSEGRLKLVGAVSARGANTGGAVGWGEALLREAALS